MGFGLKLRGLHRAVERAYKSVGVKSGSTGVVSTSRSYQRRSLSRRFIVAEKQSSILSGFCQCGCGQKTMISSVTRNDRGHIRGQALPYCHGHSSRWIQYREDSDKAIAAGLIFCRRCKEAKPREMFFESLDRHGIRCKSCSKNDHHKWRNNNRKSHKVYLKRFSLRKNYGLTLEEYQEILKKQKGKCAICGGVETRKAMFGGPKDLSVDHCHKTGKVRGLLCNRCNNGLGCFKDSVELLRAAAVYLTKER